MKTAAKVFTIIGMIVGAVGILPIIFGAITLSKMNSAKDMNELQIWGILDLIFCSVLGGIFVLCMKNEDLRK
ncbi:MAG: hypothetical protein ACI4MN_01640 [Candidatus Coproplasma sp.]